MRKAVTGRTQTFPSEPTRRFPPDNAGFSLIELLIALTLLVAALSLIPAYLSKGVSTAELKSSVRQITAGLRTVRSEAVTRNQERVFLIDLDKREFSVDPDRPALSLPQGLDIRLTTARSEQIDAELGGIRFFPDGSSTGGEVAVATDSREFSIAVDWISGKISVIDRGLPDR